MFVPVTGCFDCHENEHKIFYCIERNFVFSLLKKMVFFMYRFVVLEIKGIFILTA